MLGLPEPFVVFSGWDKRQAVAAEVFKYSVEQNASIEVDVRFLDIDKLPIDRVGVTAFTYSRFLCPWLMGFDGRCLWCDGCDQLCLGDVAELAAWDMQGKPLWVVKHPAPRHVPRRDRARSWTSLMLLDCRRFQRWTPAYVENMRDEQLMRLRDFTDDQIGELPGEWNQLCGPHETIERPPPADLYEVTAKIVHWSHLSDPNGGSWIDRSGSALWREWRERWRRERAGAGAVRPGRPAKGSAAA